jgi:hypothetical protein
MSAAGERYGGNEDLYRGSTAAVELIEACERNVVARSGPVVGAAGGDCMSGRQEEHRVS